MKIIDMHCDTIERLYRVGRESKTCRDSLTVPETLRSNQGHLDLERMRQSGYILQNFALFVDSEQWQDPWEGGKELYQRYREEIKRNEDVIQPVYTYEDVEKAWQNGKMCALLAVEEGGVCRGEVDKLRELYAMGVRMMTLTWNYENELGVPATPRGAAQKKRKAFGLTPEGEAIVREMERLGIIPDVSHLSDGGFYDLLQVSKGPFVASHSNARAICDHGRNLTDDMIRNIALRGGCVGLNFYEDFIVPKNLKGKKTSLEMLAKHATHMVNVGGVEVLGLGSDFDGIPTNSEISGVESMELVWQTLKDGGFSERDLDRLFFENVLRVYRDCL